MPSKPLKSVKDISAQKAWDEARAHFQCVLRQYSIFNDLPLVIKTWLSDAMEKDPAGYGDLPPTFRATD